MQKWDSEHADDILQTQLALEQQADLERALEQDEHPIPPEDEPHPKKKLRRELQREALTRLEDAARTLEEFQRVVDWWDRLDANRERRERYHEISRSGDELPLDYGAKEDGYFFPDSLSGILARQIQKGEFIEAIFNCPYEIHELVEAEYLSDILRNLSEDQKELLFLSAVRQFSSEKIATIRGQTDRNIRKIRNTMLKKIQKRLIWEAPHEKRI